MNQERLIECLQAAIRDDDAQACDLFSELEYRLHFEPEGLDDPEAASDALQTSRTDVERIRQENDAWWAKQHPRGL